MAKPQQQQNRDTKRDDAPNAPRDQQKPQSKPEPKITEARRGYLAKQYGYTPEQIDVVRNVICPAATDEELEFFLATAKRAKLDPFARQIYFVKRPQRVEDTWGNATWIDVGKPETSIDGLRAIAEMTEQYEGQSPVLWCGPDGEWKDVWLKKEPPHAAKSTVHRRGFREPLIAVAHFEEFCPRYKNGNMPQMWQRMGSNQIAKCAEALALRRAFPRDMSGLYTDVEMERSAVDAQQNFVAPTPVAKPAVDVTASDSGRALTEHTPDAIDDIMKALTDDEKQQVQLMLDAMPSFADRAAMAAIGRELHATKTDDTAYARALQTIVRPVFEQKYRTLPPLSADEKKQTQNGKKTQS